MSPWWSLIELSNPLHVPIQPCFFVPPLDPEHVSSQSKRCACMWYVVISPNSRKSACLYASAPPINPKGVVGQVVPSGQVYVQVTRVLVWAYSLLGRVSKSEMGPWDEQQQAPSAATTTTTTTTTTATITRTERERERETTETKGLRSEGVHLPSLRHGFRPTILK